MDGLAQGTASVMVDWNRETSSIVDVLAMVDWNRETSSILDVLAQGAASVMD